MNSTATDVDRSTSTRPSAARTVTSVALVAVVTMANCATSSDETTGVGGAPGSGGTGAKNMHEPSLVTNVGGSGAGVASGGGDGGSLLSCGNEKLEPPETCDGDAFGGKTCTDFGLNPGLLQCNTSCQIVVSGCGAPENCANGLDDDADGKVDCLDTECAAIAGCLDSCQVPQAVVLPTIDFKSTVGRPNTYSPSCAAVSGSEFIYRVTPSQSGVLGVSVSQWGGDVTVSVMGTCGDIDSELGCASATTNSNFYESLQVDVVSGSTYFVMIDAKGVDESSHFDTQMFMVGSGEGLCFDWLDGDADGFVDCSDSDCATNDVCTDGVNALGTACTFTGECAGSQDDPICLADFLGFPDGYCSEFCDLAANDCPGDALCFDYGIGQQGVCLRTCNDGGECRADYGCVDLGLASNVCYIAPESDCQNFEDDDFDELTDCDDPDCKATQGCIPGSSEYGQGCTANNQCFSQNGNDPLCLKSPPFFFTNGYCSEFCDVGASDCSSDGLCHDWFFLDGTAGQCFGRCQNSGDCASGLSCVNYGFGKHCNL